MDSSKYFGKIFVHKEHFEFFRWRMTAKRTMTMAKPKPIRNQQVCLFFFDTQEETYIFDIFFLIDVLDDSNHSDPLAKGRTWGDY